jgi:hypothetical protein
VDFLHQFTDFFVPKEDKSPAGPGSGRGAGRNIASNAHMSRQACGKFRIGTLDLIRARVPFGIATSSIGLLRTIEDCDRAVRLIHISFPGAAEGDPHLARLFGRHRHATCRHYQHECRRADRVPQELCGGASWQASCCRSVTWRARAILTPDLWIKVTRCAGQDRAGDHIDAGGLMTLDNR